MTQIDTSTEAVEALLNGVTPGPWTIQKAIVAETPFDWWIYAEGFGVLGYRTGHKEHHEGVTSWGHIETDAIFIAAARELVPVLLAERDALKAEVERLKTQAAAGYASGLDAALGVVASLGYGENESVDEGHEEAYRAIERHKSEWIKHPIAITTRPEDEVWNEAIEEAIKEVGLYSCSAGSDEFTDGIAQGYHDAVEQIRDGLLDLKRQVKGESRE